MDLVLLRRVLQESLVNISSDRSVSFASHHFPVAASFQADLHIEAKNKSKPRYDWSVLREHERRRAFTTELASHLTADSDRTL